MRIHAFATGLALLATAACSEPLVFPDWTLPVEEGTPVIEYRNVPPEEREATIEWVEELVIGDRGNTDTRYAFSRPGAVAVDVRGQIYVVDSRAPAIKVFDENGEYLRELGREGQGPGEFQDPRSIVSLEDRVIVGFSRNSRWSHFDLDGNHIEDHTYPRFDNLTLIRTTETGEIVGSTLGFTEDQRVVMNLGIYSPAGELLRPLIEYSYPNTPTIERAGRSTFFGRTPRAGPQVVVGADGGLYRTESDEYQVLALAPDGTQRWALRVATTAPPLTREEIDFVMDLVRSRYEDATESEVNLPERQPALMRMMVDGHGHLYVFPYAWEAYGLPIPPPDPIAVDVYAQDGRRLFSGMSPARSWGYAEGDHVWEIAMDPDTEEYVVRKVRLVEPFD